MIVTLIKACLVLIILLGYYLVSKEEITSIQYMLICIGTVVFSHVMGFGGAIF